MLHILTNEFRVIDPRFGRSTRVVELDMGCGKGRFTLGLAARFPDRLILGGDVMLGRLRKLGNKAVRAGLSNVELLRANNLELVGYQLPDSCVSRVHVLCPDPWPKDRHRSHRMITSDFLCRVARVLEPGGVLHLATDHSPYFDSLLSAVRSLGLYEPADDAIADISDLRTDFELRWLGEGREVPHVAFRCRKQGPHEHARNGECA
jgi:tRNA (guanine-N7-)-methyltransferase